MSITLIGIFMGFVIYWMHRQEKRVRRIQKLMEVYTSLAKSICKEGYDGKEKSDKR